jgi:hypothetical protein
MHIPMEDRGAIMGILIFQYEEGDDTRYPIHEITSKATWVPYCYRHHQISADTSTTVTPESHDTLIAAAAYVTNAEEKVDTVDDDDELTQRHDDDSDDELYSDTTINKVEHVIENNADTPVEITVGQDENRKLANNDFDLCKGL